MTENEQFQQLWKRYESDNDYKPSSAREVVDWAVDEGLLELPKLDPKDALANKMARALRQEQAVDENGRHYRVNHAVRITKDGVQHTFWGIMGFATHEHMERSFTQRREQIIGDCFHLKIDVDVYNVKNSSAEQIPLELDFTEDVAEREIVLV